MKVEEHTIEADSIEEGLDQFFKKLKGALGGGEKSDRVSHDELIAMLHKSAVNFYSPDHLTEFPFAVGNLVTPRALGDNKGAGKPFLVIEINPDAGPDFKQDIGTPAYGRRPNVRALRPYRCAAGHTHINAYWFDSGDLEFYAPPAAAESSAVN